MAQVVTQIRQGTANWSTDGALTETGRVFRLACGCQAGSQPSDGSCTRLSSGVRSPRHGAHRGEVVTISLFHSIFRCESVATRCLVEEKAEAPLLLASVKRGPEGRSTSPFRERSAPWRKMIFRNDNGHGTIFRRRRTNNSRRPLCNKAADSYTGGCGTFTKPPLPPPLLRQ